MKKYLAILELILVTIIWGGGFVASDIALQSLAPFQIMVIRFVIATILMGVMSIKQLKKVKKEEIKAGILMGSALFVGFAFQIIALQYTTPSKNAFLTATNVVIVPFIAWMICKKSLSLKGIIGAAIALIGVGVLSLEKNFKVGAGDALTLVCAFGFAFQIFLTSRYVKKYRVVVLNFIQMLTAASLSIICMMVFGQYHFQVTQNGWLSVLYLGVISTTMTYLLQTNAQKYVDETKAAIILSMESVFGTFFSIMILKEQVTGKMIIGCILILIAVIISNYENEKSTKDKGDECEVQCDNI